MEINVIKILKHKINLNDKDMYYYEDILNEIENTGYDEKCIVHDVAERSSYHPNVYNIWDEKIIKENGKYYATWSSYASCD